MSVALQLIGALMWMIFGYSLVKIALSFERVKR